MNSMLNYKKISAIVDILFDESCPKAVSKLRLEAAYRLSSILSQYSHEIDCPQLIESVWDKKIRFIRGASTAAEMKDILKPSIPRYSYGSFYCSRYHVEEEELILWAIVTPNLNVTDSAMQRYISLFKKCLPELSKGLGI